MCAWRPVVPCGDRQSSVHTGRKTHHGSYVVRATGKVSGTTNGLFRAVVLANSVQQLRKEVSGPEMTTADVEAIWKLARQPNWLDHLASSLAPSIYGAMLYCAVCDQQMLLLLRVGHVVCYVLHRPPPPSHHIAPHDALSTRAPTMPPTTSRKPRPTHPQHTVHHQATHSSKKHWRCCSSGVGSTTLPTGPTSAVTSTAS